MKEELMEILEDIRPDIDFETETALIDDGILDSMDVVALANEINETFDISIGVESFLPENFNSADAILELIRKLAEEE